MNNPHHFTRARVVRFIQIAVLIGLTSPAFSASFDCAKAGTTVEKLVCQNLFLSKLDDALAKNYGDLLKSNDNLYPKKELREEQKAWIQKRNACTDAKCLVGLYGDRVDELCRFGKHRGCILADEVADEVESSLRKPTTTPVKPAAQPAPAGPKPEGTRSQSEAPAGSPIDVTKRHASEIKALGFSDAFLKATIYLQVDMYNRPKAWMTMETWLGKLFESGNFASIARITSGRSQGVILKRPGMQSGGILFVLDGGDLFPSHSAGVGKVEPIESIGEQISITTAITQSIK